MKNRSYPPLNGTDLPLELLVHTDKCNGCDRVYSSAFCPALPDQCHIFYVQNRCMKLELQLDRGLGAVENIGRL